MKYEDRKICGLINLQSMVPDLRCPKESEDLAKKDTECDGCGLFEEYLTVRLRSILMKEENKK